MQRHRITAPLVNSTLDNGLWSDSGSGHFTQLSTYAPHEQEFFQPACNLQNQVCLLFCYAIVGLSFPSQDKFSSATQFVNITGNKASFTLPTVAVTGMYSEGVFCSRIFLSCTPLKYKTTDIWRSGFYRSQNRYITYVCGNIYYY